MQEIEYEDGEKTREFFKSFHEAADDAKKKEAIKPIKKLTITKVQMVIPKKRNKK